jgi:hypothetical protein
VAPYSDGLESRCMFPQIDYLRLAQGGDHFLQAELIRTDSESIQKCRLENGSASNERELASAYSPLLFLSGLSV